MGYTTVAIILLTFIVMLAVSNWVLWGRMALIAKYLLYIVEMLKGLRSGAKAKEPANGKKTDKKTPPSI